MVNRSPSPQASADPSTALPSGVLGRLRALRPALTPVAARIAETLLAAPEEVVHMSVTELAERAGASEGSVIGLCRQLGLRGYQHLKIALAQDLLRPVHAIQEDLEPADDPGAVARKVFGAAAQALMDTLAVLDPRALAQAVRALDAARQVQVFGIGSAAPVAEDAHIRLLRIGLDSRLSVDSHVMAIAAAQSHAQTAVLTISHSGSTLETVTATRLAREAGARTLVVTNVGRSPIMAFADIVLHTAARETRYRTEAQTSRIAQLAVVDALVSALALARGEAALAALRRTFDVLSMKRY